MTDTDPANDEPAAPDAGDASQGGDESPQTAYVWQRLWFQWVLGTIVFCLFLSFVLPPIFWVLGRLSGVLTPVLLGLGLAYIFNPVLIWAKRRHGMKRPVTAGLLLGVVGLVLAIALPLLIASAVKQGAQLAENAPQYAETVLGWFGSNTEDARRRVESFFQQFDWSQLDAGATQKALGIGAGALISVFGFLTYAAIFVLVSAFCFFVFSWRMPELKAWCSAFVPRTYRTQTFRILRMMDTTVSAIVRGRLIQSLAVMIVLCIGWYFAEVPYFLLLGVLGGALNLLPFAAILSWPLAVVLTVVDVATDSGGTLAITMAIVWPTVVYLIAQSLDGWVIEPLVQGKATGMDALTVLLVVLAGGTLLGVLGVVLAVPVAACIKILSQELLLPKLRAFAEDPPDFWQKGSG